MSTVFEPTISLEALPVEARPDTTDVTARSRVSQSSDLPLACMLFASALFGLAFAFGVVGPAFQTMLGI